MCAEKRVKPLFSWWGGKATIAPRIVKLFLPHTTFVDVFGGSAALVLAKEPSPVDVYNDLDSGCVHFFRVLREESEALQARLQLTPYSREEFGWARKTWEEVEDRVERAARWFTMARMSVAALQGWGYAKGSSRRGIAYNNSAWLSAVDSRFPLVVARFREIQIEHLDFRVVIPKYDTKDTLFYCDPPYISSEFRGTGNEYSVPFLDSDHVDLVQCLLSITGFAVLSGYPNKIYRPLEKAGWRKVDIPATRFVRPGKKEPHERSPEICWVKPYVST